MQSMFDERLWLKWLVRVRILVITLLLGTELAVRQFTPTTVALQPFVATILLWYIVAGFFILLLSFWRRSRAQSVLQVLTDLVFATILVQVTGGVDSSFNSLYPLIIIVACILLPKIWAYLNAALAFLLYGTVLELNNLGLLPTFSAGRVDWKSLQAIIFINLFGYLTIAYLAAQLVSKLRQADVQLQDTSGELKDLRAVHENIIQSISAGIITTSLDGRITLVNSAGQVLLDSSEAELVSTRIGDLFLDPLPRVGAGRAHGEARFTAKNGFRKTFRVIVSMLTVPQRGPVGFVYSLDDLTAIRRLEREVRIQDRLAAVGRLAAAIAHEIRNPLTSIAGSVQMLESIAALNEEQRTLVRIVTRESERLNAIITDFLAYSRSKRYELERVDLLQLLNDTLALLENRLVAENTGIAIRREIAVGEAPAVADGDKIKQVFWNFCENAVRAMPQGGTLTVALEAVGDDWQLTFADTGAGMSPQETEKIFEPFQSSFEGGTGLGLAIVYQIVQAHEGKVWARSKQGQGTTFVLRLHRASASEAVEVKKGPAASGLSVAVAAGQGGAHA
ncbi:MAG TPA: ATP-binding protein [Terriglobales bacterium]|nr:ATP-binding protein [Terriglobales bacterium]